MNFCIESSFAKNRHTILCGDLNTHVGHLEGSEEYSGVIGPNAPFTRNHRGEMLLQWCACHNLTVSNTLFDNDISSSWTFRGATSFTQVDYILVCDGLVQRLRTCGVLDILDIGSEHRAIRATFAITSTTSKRDVPKSRVSRNYSLREYQVALDTQLHDLCANSDPCSDGETRSRTLEQAMLSSLHSAQFERANISCADAELDTIRALVMERRQSKHLRGTPYYKSLCKKIQKLTRLRDRSLKVSKINAILDSFRGLKHIAHIQANGRKPGISRLVIADGTC